MKKVAIFASGSGTNAENIARYFFNSESINVAVVLSNKQTAGVHERVKALGIPSYTFTRDQFNIGKDILAVLKQYEVDFIVLAGFMSKISDSLLHAYPNKIINIHPSLLPKFGGKGMYGDYVHEAVIAAGETESGITIHSIDEHYDEGTVIFQASCPVYTSDSAKDLATRIHALEYEHYPKVIESLLQ